MDSKPPAKSPRSRARKIKQRLHIIFVGVECAKRGKVARARVALCNKVFAGTPGKFRLAEFHGDNIGNHTRVSSISIGKWMDSRNELMVETDEAFVERKCLVVDPVPHVSEKLWNPLEYFVRVAADIQLMGSILARPFPDVVEHLVVQVAEVRFVERVPGFHCSSVKCPIVAAENVQCFVFVEFAHGADLRNELFGFFLANRRVSVGVFVIEDEVHLDLLFKRRWTSSSISSVVFSGFWSSSAMVCTTRLTSRVARSRAGCSASSANVPDFGTSV